MCRSTLIIGPLALLIAALSGCTQEGEDRGPQFRTTPHSVAVPIYNLAIHPLHNPAKLIQAYQPLIDYLNGRLKGALLSVEASRDYANFEEKYQARQPEFILPNPWQTLQAMKVGYRVIAMAGDPQDFKGIFVVRKDSQLKTPDGLKGKVVSYPSHTALAACIMPQYFLYNHGINVNTDIENRYVGSQESSIMNAYLGQTAVGATWPPPWRSFQKQHPQEASELKVLWETDPLVNNSVMVRDDIPVQVSEQVRKLMIGLGETAQGKSILAGMETARFHYAADEDYDVVSQYISRFEHEVRPVEKP
jgi:phosphonate transport system substrate-binding protein